MAINSGFSQLENGWIFHSYVSLPEGIYHQYSMNPNVLVGCSWYSYGFSPMIHGMILQVQPLHPHFMSP